MIEKTIWKFELSIADKVSIDMPQGAEVLCVQTQFDRPCLWALCDPDAPKEERIFHVFGTGHRHMGASFGRYVDTFQSDGGRLVFHVFEQGAA